MTYKTILCEEELPVRNGWYGVRYHNTEPWMVFTLWFDVNYGWKYDAGGGMEYRAPRYEFRVVSWLKLEGLNPIDQQLKDLIKFLIESKFMAPMQDYEMEMFLMEFLTEE